MISVHRTSKHQQKNLPHLLEKLAQEGGSIVEYKCVLSAIFYTNFSTRCFWVPEHRSHKLQGLIASIPTLLLGWWSIAGPVLTLCTLTTNLQGGIDVTEAFTSPSPNGELSPEVVQKMADQAKFQKRMVISTLLAFILTVLWFCISPFFKMDY